MVSNNETFKPLSRARLACFWSLLLVIMVLATGLVSEFTLRIKPHLLPTWYLNGLPYQGKDLLHPGILQHIPVWGVPKPHFPATPQTTSGPVPADLQHMGLVNPGENPDPATYPAIVFEYDELGFPNHSAAKSADILLVGDSFTFAMGAKSPSGLQYHLGQATGKSIYNLGLPGLGPHQAAYLLETFGLPLEPDIVLWFFYGGNDTYDARQVIDLLDQGYRFHSDRSAEYPFSLAQDFLEKYLKPRRSSSASPGTALPGFNLKKGNEIHELWFNPRQVRHSIRSARQWKDDTGLIASQAVIQDVAETLEERTTRFLLVYIPSKVEAYLPFVEKNPELLHAVGSFTQNKPMNMDPDTLWMSSQANLHSLEQVMEGFAMRKGIPFLSLTPYFHADARAPTPPGFLSADTHWNEHGQYLALEPLTRWLDSVNE